MFPYFALLALPSAFALADATATLSVVMLVLIVYTLFGGLRFQVGMDWFNYDLLHKKSNLLDFADIMKESEPLSWLLFKMSLDFGGDMTLTNLFGAGTLIAGVVAYSLRSPMPWIGVIAATPYLVIAFGMSGIRQGIGVGLTLFALAQWKRWGLLRQLALIGFAAMFHTSAAVMALFPLAASKVSTSIKALIIVPALGAAVFLVSRSAAVPEVATNYANQYVNQTNAEANSDGALFHISFVLIPALIAVARRKEVFREVSHPDLVWFGIIGAFMLVPLSVISSTGASRLSLFFYFVPIAVYPAFIKTAFRHAREFAVAVFIAVHFALLYLWLEYATNSYAHLPYRNVLFLD